jgi:hypothetical protein
MAATPFSPMTSMLLLLLLLLLHWPACCCIARWPHAHWALHGVPWAHGYWECARRVEAWARLR